MKSTKAPFGIILLLVTAVFTGCKSTDIVQLAPDTYTITVEDHAGIFGGSAAKLKSRTIREADIFAENKGKVAIPVFMQQHPVGMGFRDWASCEYQFELLDKNDPKAVRTTLVPQTDPVVETQQFQQQMQRQAIMQQNWANQQKQFQANQNSLDQKAAEYQRTADNLELQIPSLLSVQIPSQPILPNIGLMSQPNLMGGLVQQQEPNLPSAADMQYSIKTGNVKFTPGGKWHEYRTASGVTYWKLDQ